MYCILLVRAWTDPLRRIQCGGGGDDGDVAACLMSLSHWGIDWLLSLLRL